MSARPSRRKAKAMRVPSILQGEALTQILQGMVTGAVAMLVFGFYWGGWITND
jgi:hypothetical protein